MNADTCVPRRRHHLTLATLDAVVDTQQPHDVGAVGVERLRRARGVDARRRVVGVRVRMSLLVLLPRTPRFQQTTLVAIVSTSASAAAAASAAAPTSSPLSGHADIDVRRWGFLRQVKVLKATVHVPFYVTAYVTEAQ